MIVKIRPSFLNLAQRLLRTMSGTKIAGKEISIFLCGGDGDGQKDFRYSLGKAIDLEKTHGSFYSTFYPETLFFDLTLGRGRYDLLSMENLLAKSVTSVAILLQSPGTFTELGAFANNVDLAKKLIVVIEPKYRGNKSFINLGPIQYLSSSDRDRIIYERLIPSNKKKLALEIGRISRRMAREDDRKFSLQNPIDAFKYLYGLIYIASPIPREVVCSVANRVAEGTEQETKISVEAALYSLIGEGFVKTDGMLLRADTSRFGQMYSGIADWHQNRVQKAFSSFRATALNLTHRKKGVWEVSRF